MNKKKNIEEVIPSIRLNKLVEEWNASGSAGAKAPEKTSAAWLRLCRFVRDKPITRAQLHYALIKIRGMKESSAGVVASRLLKFQKSAEASALLDRALAGENITIRDLRGEGANDSPKEIVKAKLRNAARSAIEESMKYDAYMGEASAAYAQARILADARSVKQSRIVLDEAEEVIPYP